MKLIDKIKNNTLIFPLQSEEKSTTIHELLNLLLSEGYLTEMTKLFSFIENDDKTLGSAVGRGIAFHHSSSVEVNEMTAVLGISKIGVDYQSPDRQRVHFILLILDSINEPNLHRKFIHRFQKFINDNNIKTKILECTSKEEVVNIINDWENQYLLNANI